MLMKNECSVISSVKVKLTFDDATEKERILSTGDLIECEYNANGLRKHIIGKIIKISTVGTDPKGWYLVVDGSDDFGSDKARFSPMSILDVDVLRKADSVELVNTPIDDTGVPYLRIKRGYLQISRDGINWWDVRTKGHGHHPKPAHDPDFDNEFDDLDCHHHAGHNHPAPPDDVYGDEDYDDDVIEEGND